MTVPLVALLLLAAPLPAWAGDCAVPLLGRPDEYMNTATDTPQPFSADAPECQAAVTLLEDFRRLLTAAKLSESLSLRVHPATFSNASFNPDKRSVTLTLGLLRSTQPRDEKVFGLAHEIGHALQYRGGTGAAHRALSDRLNEKERLGTLRVQDYRTWNNFSRPFEAHADLLGMELLVRAGYGVDAARVAAQRFSDCGTVEQLSAPAPNLHPHEAQRAFNAVLGQVLLSADSSYHSSLEDFDGAGRFLPREGPLATALRRAAVDPAAQRSALRSCRIPDAELTDRSLSIVAWGRLLN